MTRPIPNPAEFAGDSGRTPAVTTRRIDVLTQRTTKAESAIKDLNAMISRLMEICAELEQRVAELEARPSGRGAAAPAEDQLYLVIRSFLVSNKGLKFSSGSVTDNVAPLYDGPVVGKVGGNLVRGRLERLVSEGVAQKAKTPGRDTMFWVEADNEIKK